MTKTETEEARARWVLLIHQLPAKPAYQRVKTWRRLQGLGAVAIKNAVHALPAGEQAQDDFEWLVREIREGGGEALICEARLVDGLSDQEVQAMFNAAREADYDPLAKEVRAFSETLDGEAAAADLRTRLARLKSNLGQIFAIDYFSANGREIVDRLILGLEQRLDEEGAMAQSALSNAMADSEFVALTNRVWVTRQGVYVDRIASAWLIRRFIDSDLNDPALSAIAGIVHDIDLKDTKFGREETGGIAHLVTGLCHTNKDDARRLEQGAGVFDNLYEYFRKRRG
jgi:hypothetical protein